MFVKKADKKSVQICEFAKNFLEYNLTKYEKTELFSIRLLLFEKG